MKRYFFSTILALAINFLSFGQNALDLSYHLMMSAQMNQPTADEQMQLAEIPFDTLVNQLDTDSKKKAFWMNIYAAYSQDYIRKNNLDECDNKCKRAKTITIGQRVFSLNQILYGILLHSKAKIYQGKKIISPKWEKQLRVSYPDGRVVLAIYPQAHIAELHSYFDAENLDAQLNTSATTFLKKYVYFKVDQNKVYVPKWLKHFSRDFGKKVGMVSGLKIAGVVGEGLNPQIEYSDKIATFKD